MISGELRVLAGPDTGAVFGLAADTIVGHRDGADLILRDDEVSGRHLRLTLVGGAATIEDLDSTNGTFLNGEPLVGRRKVRSGDRIALGVTVLEYVAPVPSGGAGTSPEPLGSLRVTGGPDAGGEASVSTTVTIGRNPDCDLVLSDDEVSRHHARVSMVDGEALVEDLGSTHGTFVNGEPLLVRHALEPGDRIEIGQAVIEYSAAGRPATSPRAVPAQVTAVRHLLSHAPGLRGDRLGSRKWWTLLCVCVGVFMLLLDTTIVAVALPSISKALHTTFSELQWVVDAYALSLAVFLLTAGSLADVFGRRQVFVAGLVLFTATSALCGLAPSPVVLDLARGVQGIGGAMMFATSLALLAQEFPPKERGVAFGMWGAAAGAATALGPLAGGVLTQAFGWGAIFYVNIPIGVAILYLTLRKLVNVAGERTPVDWLGLATVSTGLFALVLAIIRGNDNGWTSPLIVGLLVGGSLMLVAFLLVESRAAHPMLDLSLFRIPTFNGAAIVGFTLQGSYVALILYITLWFASILGYSPFETGLRLLPLFGVGFLVAPIGGRLSAKLHARWMLAVGMTAIAGGLLLMHSIKSGSHWTVLLSGEVLCGVGAGTVNAPLGTAAIAVVGPTKSGMASGVNGTFRQLGMVVGIAAFGAVFQYTVRTHVVTALAHTPVHLQAVRFGNAIAAGGTPQLLARTPVGSRAALQSAAASSFASGLADIFLLGAVVALVGAIAGLVMVREKDYALRSGNAPPPAAA